MCDTFFLLPLPRLSSHTNALIYFPTLQTLILDTKKEAGKYACWPKSEVFKYGHHSPKIIA